jgi:hypothetical protein
LPSCVEQLLALGAVLCGIRAHASMASVTVQPRPVAHVRIASLCRARVCWSWGDTRADRATRRGDTKPPGKWRKPTVEFPEVRGAQISGGKPLVLCQPGSQGTSRTYSSRRCRGSPVYLGRAVTTGPHTRGRSLSWGVWTGAAQPRHHYPATQERRPHCGTACYGV